MELLSIQLPKETEHILYTKTENYAFSYLKLTLNISQKNSSINDTLLMGQVLKIFVLLKSPYEIKFECYAKHQQLNNLLFNCLTSLFGFKVGKYTFLNSFSIRF